MGIIVEDQYLFHHYRQGEYLRILQDIQQKDSRKIQDILLAGLAYFQFNELEKSRKCIDFVLKRSAEESTWVKHAHFLQGQLCIVEGDWDTAILTLEDLLCMDYALEAQVINSLAYVHWRTGNTKEAIWNLERILQMEDDNTAALNSLGFILADTEEDLPKARKLCERATELKRNYSPYLDSLGWALYKLGQRAKAIYTLRRALVLTPKDTEVYGHLQEASTY